MTFTPKRFAALIAASLAAGGLLGSGAASASPIYTYEVYICNQLDSGRSIPGIINTGVRLGASGYDVSDSFRAAVKNICPEWAGAVRDAGLMS